MRRSLSRQAGFTSAKRRPASRHAFAFALLCALVFGLYCGAAAAEPRNRPVPPQAGLWTVRHAGADARDDHGPKPHQPAPNTSNPHHDHSNQHAPAITPAQAAQRARDRFSGRVLNVILEHERGGPYYRVTLLEQGRVRVVDIDARR